MELLWHVHAEGGGGASIGKERKMPVCSKLQDILSHLRLSCLWLVITSNGVFFYVQWKFYFSNAL